MILCEGVGLAVLHVGQSVCGLQHRVQIIVVLRGEVLCLKEAAQGIALPDCEFGGSPSQNLVEECHDFLLSHISRYTGVAKAKRMTAIALATQDCCIGFLGWSYR